MLINQMNHEQAEASMKFYDKFVHCEGWQSLTDSVFRKASSKKEFPQRFEFEFVYVNLGNTIFADTDIDSLLFSMGVSDNEMVSGAIEKELKKLTLSVWEA
jgi:hypothetical protein